MATWQFADSRHRQGPAILTGSPYFSQLKHRQAGISRRLVHRTATRQHKTDLPNPGIVTEIRGGALPSPVGCTNRHRLRPIPRTNAINKICRSVQRTSTGYDAFRADRVTAASRIDAAVVSSPPVQAQGARWPSSKLGATKTPLPALGGMRRHSGNKYQGATRL